MLMNLFGALLAVMIAAAGQPAAKPDFSGDWKIAASKSNFGPMPPPTVYTRKITHAEPTITIVEQQQSAMGEQSMTRKYSTDGKETTFEVAGMPVRSSATWSGNALVFASIVDSAGLSINDTMSLSPDGKTLTSVVHVTSAQGDIDLTVVFEKQ